MNKVTLIGNLTRDPELKYTPAGTAVCTFGVATNRTWTTVTGEQKEDTQFHRIVAWQKLAELCGKLLTKGKKIYLEGRITYRSFVGKDGMQRSITEIVMDDFIVFDSGRRMDNTIPNSPATIQPETHNEISETPEEKNELVSEEIKTNERTASKKNKTEEDEKVNPDDIPF
jgi:single-strand DNA-binding protein